MVSYTIFFLFRSQNSIDFLLEYSSLESIIVQCLCDAGKERKYKAAQNQEPQSHLDHIFICC